MEPMQQSDWSTPPFANIKKKKTKRLSPYLESELWERDEILSLIKYEPHKRNKARFGFGILMQDQMLDLPI